MAEITREVMEDDALKALKVMWKINDGDVLRRIDPGEAVRYNLFWETGEVYTESFLAMLFPALQPEEITVSAEGFPDDTTGGISIVLCKEKNEDHVGTIGDLFNALGGEDTGLNETNSQLLELRIVSAE